VKMVWVSGRLEMEAKKHDKRSVPNRKVWAKEWLGPLLKSSGGRGWPGSDKGNKNLTREDKNGKG